MSAESLLPVARQILRVHQTRGAAPLELARALSVGTLQALASGALLCTEGEPSDVLFVLVSGAVRVLRRDPGGSPRELAVLEAPALVGQMGVVDGSPRSATCEASGPTEVLRIPAGDFHRLLGESSAASAALRRLLLSSLIQQLSLANQKVQAMIAPAPAPSAAGAPEEDVSDGDILRLAGVLDGWSVDRQSIDQQEVYFTEDEAMRRARESQSGKL